MTYLGIDIGSVSVKAARISAEGALLDHVYRRHNGHPMEVARGLLAEVATPDVTAVGFTGSGSKRVAEVLGAPFENEVLCQARAAGALLPGVNSLIVVGGEDSFLLMLDRDAGAAAVPIKDFAMNGLCAAGCGSFLDQQAGRLGVNIEGEFGTLALQSAKPARVAGRCSVFAKTDMIHLQQQATPMADIVAGLCFAFARNFMAVLARGKEMSPPVAFCGGVSLNAGMVRAFRETLGLSEEAFIVPDFAAASGAAGAALLARSVEHEGRGIDLAALDAFLARPIEPAAAHAPLPDPGPPPGSHVFSVDSSDKVDAFLGVDVGSISTNVVLIDDQKRVLAKSYLMTAGRPIEAVRQGLEDVGGRRSVGAGNDGRQLADRVNVRGVCTTGSGRYLTGDFLGADLVKNEITAQARAAAEIDPQVDTIFEIGGQDSKYISLERGAIVDFEMNKVCAAGTGSFLEEQATRLGISIKGEFAHLALGAEAPVRLGERCTVFMESDLVGHQARGAATPELAAGLAYSIVHNYLNRVVAQRKVGERIFFQGGTAFNRAVVAAFREVTGKDVQVPEHHEVTGAIGCALMARENARPGLPSRFKGWDLSSREYTQDSFECKGCANACTINRVRLAGVVAGPGRPASSEETLFYGGRCEKYEKKRADVSSVPDLFAERQTLLMGDYVDPQPAPSASAQADARPYGPAGGTSVPAPRIHPSSFTLHPSSRPLIGLPRTLHFSEYAPFWRAFFAALGLPVRFSAATNRTIINAGLEATTAEFCFPVKVSHGHVLDLMAAGVTHLFLPNVQQLPRLHASYKESVPCPFVQSLPYTIRAAIDPESKGVKVLAPVIELNEHMPDTITHLAEALADLGVSRADVVRAVDAAQAAQREFTTALARRGREVLAGLAPDATAVVIVSRPYNGCDPGINLELPTRFRELGVLPIPMDMLPIEDVDLSDEFPDLTWRYGQKILAAADLIRRDPRLHAVYVTNFGCGPDSFLLRFFRARMGEKTFLQLEIDEHSSDVGVITRIEAFLDSLHAGGPPSSAAYHFRVNAPPEPRRRTLYFPLMCDAAHAVAAAFRSVGYPAVVLPESDSDSVALGKNVCSGKECFPCLVTTGDFLKHLQRPDTDPDDVSFFMPSVAGGCRFGYYNLLQRLVLDEMGLRDVPIFSPNQSAGLYTSMGKQAGLAVIRRAWQGIVAVELLDKALHTVRPDEQTPGVTDKVYDDYLKRVIAAVESGSDLLPLMRAARAAFEGQSPKTPVLSPHSPRQRRGPTPDTRPPIPDPRYPTPDTRYPRPFIGVIGEVFVRSHAFSNQQLARRVEELGGRVWFAPLTEWLLYVNVNQKEDAWRGWNWTEIFRVGITDRVMKADERRLAAPWEGFIPHLHELPPEALIAEGRRYVDPAFRGEAILGVGKAVEFHRRGLSGVINVMPFTCMPGLITSSVFKRFQADHDNIPVLNLAFEGQECGDLPIRLEAFLQQCRSYQTRRKKK